MKVTPQMQAILDRIALKSTEAQNILDKNGFADDDLSKVLALNGEIKTMQGQFDALSASEGLKGWANAPVNQLPAPGASSFHESGTKDADIFGYTEAGHNLLGRGPGGVLKVLEEVGPGSYSEKTYRAISEDTYLKAFCQYLRGGEKKLGATALKDIQEGIDSQGGYWAPPQMIARIISRMAAPTVLGGKVQTITASGDRIIMPKVNYADANEQYSTGFRVTYTGETPAANTAKVADANLFGETVIQMYTAMMTTQLPRDFVEDAGVDIQGWVAGKFSETINLETDRTIVSGTGIGQPLGIIPATAAAGADAVRVVHSGNANLLTPNGIIDLIYSLPEQYVHEGCASVMNRTSTGRQLRELVDAQSRYLFGSGYDQSGLADERNPKLVGYDNIFSRFLPNIAAGAYPIIFGDWTGYAHAVRLGLSIQILQEVYSEQNKIGLVGRFRHGGRPLEPWKLAAQLISA